MTRQGDGQNEVLRQYLLGSTPEGEWERLEEALLADDRLYEDLLATEVELIDEYVRRRLPESERAGFRQYLSSLPDHEQKLKFAEALHARLLESPPNEEALPRPVLRVNKEGSRGRVRWFLPAAAILLALLGGIWSLARISDLREEVGRAQADVARLQEEQDALRERAAGSAPSRSFLLSPGTFRSGGTRQVLAISGDPELLEFRLDLGSDEYDSYRAVVHDAETVELASLSQLTARTEESRILVVFHASSNWFPPGDYYVSLLGVLGNGEPEAVARYVFRVSQD